MYRLLCALPILLISFTAPQGTWSGPTPTKVGGTTPRAAAKKISLPFTLRRNHMILEVTLNGRKMEAILDTGMPMNGILLTREDDRTGLELDYTSKVNVGGAGGEPVAADFATGASITIGEIKLENQSVLAMPPVEKKRLHVDAVIGYSLFGKYVVALDYVHQTIDLYDPKTFRPDADMTEIPLEMRNNYPYVHYSITQADGSEISLTTTLDLGANNALMLFPDAHSPIVVPDKKLACRIGRGATDDMNGHMGRIKSLRLGPFEFRNVLTSYAGKDVGPVARLSPEGNLGAEIMKRFDITMDYKGSRIFLKPNQKYSNPFDFNMVGVQLTGQTDGSFRVDRILAGSGAEKAGIVVGDVIVMVNGQPAAAVGTGEVIGLMRSGAGKTITFGIRRNGEVIEYRVKLKILV